MKFISTALMLLTCTLLLSDNAYAERSVPALIEAIWKNDVEKVELLIRQGADVNVKHDDTALVTAVSGKSRPSGSKIVTMLLNAKGIDVNRYSTCPMGAYSWYRTPLIAAVYDGNVEAVKLLLAKGAKVNLTDQHVPGNSVEGPEPLNTALMYAAEKGYYEIAEMLLNKGANIEQMNAKGQTPLMFSVHLVTDKSDALTKENAVKVAALLLNRGAKVDNCGFSSNVKFLKIALPKGTPSSVNPNVIVRGGGGVSALMMIAENGFIEGARLLLDRGANIELKQYGNKCTALIIAAKSNKTAMVNFLLDRGANVEATDTVGHNSLLIASSGLYYETVSALLKKGANVNAFIPTTGDNALMYAINQGREDQEDDSLKMVELLIENGININFQGSQGNTPLMYASGCGVVTKNPDRAKLLLKKGAKINLQNKKGETALMHAAYRGHVDIAELLLDKGATIDLKDAKGRTALMTASAAVIDLKDNRSEFPELVKLLLDKGADINAKDKNKSTALSLATQNRHKKIISVLVGKGGKIDGAEKKDGSGKVIVGTWEGIQNSNPYELHRFTFNSDNTWTYQVKATAALLKTVPASQHKAYNESLNDKAKLQGNKGTYAFREQYLVLNTNSMFSSERVFGWSVENRKLHLNGMEFILSKVSK